MPFGVKTERSYDGSLKNMEAFLREQAAAERFPLLLIDDAQNLNLDELRLVHHMPAKQPEAAIGVSSPDANRPQYRFA